MNSPSALVALVGRVVAFFGCRERLALVVALLAGSAAGVAAAFGLRIPANIAALAAPAAAVASGLIAVAATKAPDVIAVVLSIAVGLSAGIAAGLDTPGWGSALGVSCAVTALVGFTLAVSQDLMTVRRITTLLPLARRVLGAWVAAIGLLTGTLVLHLQRG
ncbi:MAG: hypothetical protein LH632_12865 [Rhodoferax sp.]|nr:hypothetical protein [Rhodoferax sp.]